MRIDVLTLFPGMFAPVLSESVIGRALQKGIIDIRLVDIRNFSLDKHKKTDDYPYGGGSGMVMTAQPLYDAWCTVTAHNEDKVTNDEYKITNNKSGGAARTIYMSPQGTPLTQKKAIELSLEKHLIIICGHYEGVDERVLELIADEEISIGDYVLTGGEIPAMAIIDCVARLIPGVLSNEAAIQIESHNNGLLEYPQYTRPASFMGMDVPQVLLDGNHADIEKWRLDKSYERTRRKRPDLMEAYPRRLFYGATYNLRDLGGYPATNGAVTRWRMYYRSDLVQIITEQDKAAFLAIKLTTVIDLRSREEVERAPNAFSGADWIAYHNIPLLPEAVIDKCMTTSPFKELYILFVERGKKKLGRVFTILAESSGPCLFHCLAGKDRTGIIAALLLMLVDVPREDVVADYEVSGTYYWRKVVRLDEGANAATQAHIRSNRETINYFIDHIISKYGDAEGYLLGAGVTDENIKTLRDRFLSPPVY